MLSVIAGLDPAVQASSDFPAAAPGIGLDARLEARHADQEV
jgi:hypothetical protein